MRIADVDARPTRTHVVTAARTGHRVLADHGAQVWSDTLLQKRYELPSLLEANN